MQRLPLVVAALVLGSTALGAQTLAAQSEVTSKAAGAVVPETPGAAKANVANAMRAEQPPVIDGRDDDAAWAEAEAITQFREFQPRIDAEPRFRTEAKVTYDDRYFYAFVRAFDPHPDSIVSLLSRRDVRTNSEQIKLIVDSYHDRRSGFQFAVNPAGVKRDYTVVNDVEEDGSWDGVWDVATRTDSLGWTAEYRIPLSQLRFARKDVHTFGFAVVRDVARTGERYSWPLYDRRKYGVVSQLGEIRGITGLGTPRRLEVMPYAVSKSATRVLGRDELTGIENDFDRKQSISGGADVKYGVTSNLTLDATINPDFGQVEADPAQVNLNNAEFFLDERRPFFVEGSGVLQFRAGGPNGLFYSRRIGRAPGLLGAYGDEDSPASTTILGAAKLTGRLQSGLSVGVLAASTQREVGARTGSGERATIEPASSYLVSRFTQDLRGGRTGIGLMATAVDRRLDEYTRPYMRSDAYTAGLDFRHRLFGDNYQLTALVAASHVRGDTAAIRRLQQSYVHQYQRPGDDLEVDPTRTSLSGHTERIGLSKVGGGIVRWDIGYRAVSPGFELNDVGFLNRADEHLTAQWLGFQFTKPKWIYRNAQLNVNQYNSWTYEGLRTTTSANVNGWMELRNQWQVDGGIEVSGLPGTYNDRSAQGGRAVRRSQWWASWQGIGGDPRMRVVPYWNSFVAWGDEGRSVHVSFSPSVEIKAGSQFSVEVGPRYRRMDDHSQQYFFGGPEQFATLDYRESAIQTRINYTATPNLSLQVYAEPFISSIDFSDLRQIGDPHARKLDDRYVPVAGSPEPFDYTQKQLRMNSVLRWEYRPGSTIFFVWSQDRDDAYGSDAPTNAGLAQAGSFRPGRDYTTLFERHPKNTFLIKASYWFSL